MPYRRIHPSRGHIFWREKTCGHWKTNQSQIPQRAVNANTLRDAGTIVRNHWTFWSDVGKHGENSQRLPGKSELSAGWLEGQAGPETGCIKCNYVGSRSYTVKKRLADDRLCYAITQHRYATQQRSVEIASTVTFFLQAYPPNAEIRPMFKIGYDSRLTPCSNISSRL